MKSYILGNYCVTDFDLEILHKNSNQNIIKALLESYPSGLTAQEISKKTKLPIKTVYTQTKELFREHFINDLYDEPKPRGRPKKNDKHSSLTRKSIIMTIENANSLFASLFVDEEEKKNTHLPPGNVKYSIDFLKTIPKLLVKEDQDEINHILLNTIKKIYRIAIESKDKDIQNLAPSTYKGQDKNKEDYRCSHCGLNHEARDFIRAILLYMIDQFEQSKNFIDFLKEKELVTNDAYTNVIKKLK